MARVSVHPVNALQSGQASAVAGIWVEGKKGTIGLVADDNVGTYLCFYGPGHRNRGKLEANPLPALVIALDAGARPQLQLPEGPSGVRFLTFDRILEAIGKLSEIGAREEESAIVPNAP